MKTSKTIAITVAMLGVLGFGGLMRTVYARSPQAVAAIVPHHSKLIAEASDGDGEANNATEPPENKKYSQSPIAPEASDGDGEVNDKVEEQQEQAKLQPLAKITASQAQKVAETSASSKASSVKLENEDGNLVYTVIVGQNEVKVDAGNGKVLYAESENDEKDATSRPKSSIQVPQTESGDREQGEMNEGAK